MSFESKISTRAGRRKNYQIVFEGVGSVNIEQKMRYARRFAKSGSLDGDWRIVGREIAGAISSMKREFSAD